jgi:ribonuclease HI
MSNKYGIPSLTYSNFAVWRPKIVGLLESKGMQGALTDDEHADSSKALGQLKLYMDDSILGILNNINNCRDAWDTLLDLFASTAAANVMQLKRQLTAFSLKGKEDIAAYMQRARRLQFELEAAEVEIREEDLIMTIMAGLPSDYDTIRTIILNTEPLPAYPTVLSRLLRVEADLRSSSRSSAFMMGTGRGGFSNRGGYRGSSSSSSYANSGNVNGNNNSSSTRGGGDGKKGVRCHYCHKRGHLKKECYKRINDLSARNNQNNRGSGNGRNDRRPRAAAFMVMSNSCETDEWYLDTAAGRHMTTDVSVLSDIYTLDDPVEVRFASGHKDLATMAGGVTLVHLESGDTIRLSKVLLAPAVDDELVNLISVGTMTASGLTEVNFSRDHALITGRDGFSALAPACGEGMYAMKGWKPVKPKYYDSTAAMMVKVKPTAAVWHSRMGHVGYDNLSKMISQDMVTGIDISTADIAASKLQACEACEKGKMTRKPFPSSSTQVSGPLDLIHMDLCGPIEESRGGNKYIATYKDDYSGMSWVDLTSTKKELAAVIKARLTLLQNQSSKKIKTVRTDNGREYVNENLGSYLREQGIKHEHSMPYTPQQNGVAERLNRTLLERARPMLSEAGLPLDMWGEVIRTANYLRTLAPEKGKMQTPWELYYGNKPDLSHLRSFGCRAYVMIPKQMRTHKLAEVSQTGVMVGYAVNGKGWRILMDDDGQVCSSRDVVFDEHQFPGSPWGDVPSLCSDSDSDSEDGDDAADGADEEEEGDPQPGPNGGQPSNSSAPPATPPPLPEPEAPEAPDAPRPTRNRQAPRYLSENYYMAAVGSVQKAIKIEEPSSYNDALKSEHADLWKAAADDEMASILSNDTWEVVEPPPGANIIGSRWVFKVKYDTSGNVSRFKARLVAQGYKQVEGLDYNEVFAPVSKYTTIRTMMALVAAEDMEMELLDIKTAFLNGTLQEEVYLKHPPGYPQGPPGTVLRLKKTLYGLKQAPRAWHQRLDAELHNIGFTPSAADPGLYISTKDNNRAYLMVYVDDILIASSSKSLINTVKTKLSSIFDARDMGAATAYLGMKIERDRGSRKIKLTQTLMTQELVAKYNMDDCKTKATPLSPSIKLSAEDGDPLDTDKFPYSQLVGSLMYIAVCTRPDISYAVGALARYMAKPTTVHWQAAKGVLRYLAGTADFGITFGSTTDGLIGYCDADYAGDTDTRRSTTGYVFLMAGGAVSWSSKRQQTIAASTTEAEYMAAAAAVKEALWLRNLLADFNIQITPVTLFADNQSAIKLLRNPISSLRSKHIDVIHHFARERVMKGDVMFSYIRTDDMLADMMTKALAGPKHFVCCKGIGVGT